MLNIAVVFGGKSVEHDISVITGTLTLNTLDKTKYNPIPIFIDKDGLWWTAKEKTLKGFSNFNTKKGSRVTFKIGEDILYKIKGKKVNIFCKIDCVINCTHGYNGEDGTISGLIKLCNIPLASPNEFCSSFSMDKEYTKIVLKGLGVKTLDYKVLYRQDFFKDKLSSIKSLNKLEYPIIIKPARLGSSIGIGIAKDFKELVLVCEKCFNYDDKLLIEPLIEDFTEINCAVYKGKSLYVSELEKPISTKNILSFEDKYEGKAEKEFPAKIDKELYDKIRQTSAKIYTALNFSGVIRIDYIIKDSVVYLNEINSIPGSMAYYLFCSSFTEFSIMLKEVVEDAIFRHQEFIKNQFKTECQILLTASNLKK